MKTKLKIGTLSPIPLGISYMLLIPTLGVVISKFESFKTLNGNYKYLTVLLIVLIISKGLHYIYSGKVKIISTSDEDFEIKIEKQSLFSKLKNQNIKLDEIEHFKVSNGRACDRIIIELKNKENVRFCTDNLKNFFSLKNEKADLINLFIKKGIKQRKASWKDGF
ncbi:hypothetical protein G1J88_11620 [Tenacibaculum dicentrarchi]|uniref:hypothetical protein n=1 Tax=Tenacibaculum finnmarkense TaxID=2781243 RepID=UPI001E2A83E8|nr:hypothetical protein [Tenacibaculum finnmarkense]MCD8408595.1 hypothetical protein [Tenacibaculum dicentrarchi]MCD8425019.1 hypothetical protein [Tenacibaculum dicentrarchi]MCD8435997.1 hypothetical protein [Tenacibaculum dicentrarchi]MCD8438290.1 hypothetical protein [Tenacibaculum dicentrarchi]MCD8443178.1 hypothetical protein [Tenacibaculum dicentrarchi]